MPLAPVDQHGSHLYYEDTGAPPHSSNYPTLVLVHGAGFQGAVFERLFAHAAQHNMRLVAVNMRDYHGSTLYSPAELADLSSPDMYRQAEAVRARGLELLRFLLWFVREEHIPPLSLKPSGGGLAGGGMSLLGWSWGTKIVLSCVAHASELALDDVETLERYMWTLILFDPSPRAFGAPISPLDQSYNPLNDHSLTQEEISRIFPGWVSGYYAHSTTMLDTLPFIRREELIAGFSQTPIPDPPPRRSPTLRRMSEDELSRVINGAAVARSHLLFEVMDSKVYEDNAFRALGDTSTWPGLRVVLAWCDMSVSETVLSTWDLLSKVHEGWSANGRQIRALRLKGANHFPHWGQPERMMQVLAGVIQSAQIPASVDIDGTGVEEQRVHSKL